MTTPKTTRTMTCESSDSASNTRRSASITATTAAAATRTRVTHQRASDGGASLTYRAATAACSFAVASFAGVPAGK